MEVRIRPSALDDIAQLLEYIAAENPSAAVRIVDDIEKFCLTTLSDNPHIGTNQSEIFTSLRVFPIAGYRVCYFVRETHIDVVRVLHHARDLPRHIKR